MDKTELTRRLQVFRESCEKQGYPLKDVCLEEAYPGITTTSFIVKVVAEWADNLGSCSNALDILINILWDTVDEETRKYIFAINIHDSQDQLHCMSDPIHESSSIAAT